MLARLRKMQEENEEGFTLIELLVVIIIIGILAAIAIPVFLNQRQKGYDAGIKSDLRNAATAEETYLTDNSAY
jgi:type IV pilus assembly protein PilA